MPLTTSSALRQGGGSLRTSAFREFALMLSRHDSDTRIPTEGKPRFTLDELDSKNPKKLIKAVADIQSNIKTIEEEKIPIIWTKAMSVLDETENLDQKRMLLELLKLCCMYCGGNETVRLAFYFTILDRCCIDGEKAELNKDLMERTLDLYCECLDALTKQGLDVELFEQSNENLTLSEFLSLCLRDLPNFNTKTSVSFLQLLNDCLRKSSMIVQGLDNVVKSAQRTSDATVLINCLHTIEILINNGTANVSSQDMSDLVNLITGAINLNNKLNQRLLRLLDILIDSKYWDQTWNALTDLIQNTNVPLHLRGSVTILMDLALQDKEDWLFWLTQLFKHGTVVYGQILQCIDKLINDESFVRTRPHTIWNCGGKSNGLLNMFTAIASFEDIKINNPNTIKSINDGLLKAFEDGLSNILGFKDQWSLLRFLLLHKDVLKEDQWMNLVTILNEQRLPIPNDIFEILFSQLSIENHLLEILISYFSSTYEFYKEESRNQLCSKIIPMLSEDCNLSIYKIITAFVVVVSDHISENQLKAYVDSYLCPKTQRRKSFVKMNTDQPKDKWILEEQAKALAQLFLKHLSLFPCVIKMWRHCLKLKYGTSLLILARVLLKMRIDTKGNIYFGRDSDIEGLTATFRRNLNVSGVDYDVNLSWCHPEDGTIEYVPISSLENRDLNQTLSHIDSIEWIDVVVDTLRKPPDWEVYTFILSHLCPQLANICLFDDAIDKMEDLINLMEIQLKDGPPIRPTSNLYKSDVQVAYVRTLSSIFPYYKYLSKSKSDDMIEVLLFVLESSSEKSIVPILHILTISCYEIPSSVKKHLNKIIEIISIRLTNKQAIAPLLEFLIALSDSVEIIDSLTIDQFKRVFTVSFKLIEVSEDLKKSAAEMTGKRPSIYQEQLAALNPSTTTFTITKSMAHLYLSLSFQIISLWFMRISLAKRPIIAPFLISKLAHLPEGPDTDAYRDLITRFTTTDLELRVEIVTTDRPHRDDPNYTHGYWYHHNKLISVETETQTGSSLVVIRGCSGNSVFNVNPVIKRGPPTIDLFDIAKDNLETPSNEIHQRTSTDVQNVFMPGHIITQFGDPFNEKDLLRISDPSLIKSIQLFDTIPVVEFHRIGLIYMTEGDQEERDILSKSISDGSYQYNWFINQLGSIIRLSDNDTFYVGGLTPESDGEYALVWHDQTCQIVFQAITLMPNNNLDPDRTMKKRHVGNNFVNIYYDERNVDSFPFDILKSQFNFINIVIKPLQMTNSVSQFYKVKLYRAEQTPGIFSSAHFKIMHRDNLANYIRRLSTLSDIFAQTWHGTVTLDHCSTWSRRAAQIQNIKTRAEQHSTEILSNAHSRND